MSRRRAGGSVDHGSPVGAVQADPVLGEHRAIHDFLWRVRGDDIDTNNRSFDDAPFHLNAAKGPPRIDSIGKWSLIVRSKYLLY